MVAEGGATGREGSAIGSTLRDPLLLDSSDSALQLLASEGVVTASASTGLRRVPLELVLHVMCRFRRDTLECALR